MASQYVTMTKESSLGICKVTFFGPGPDEKRFGPGPGKNQNFGPRTATTLQMPNHHSHPHLSRIL